VGEPCDQIFKEKKDENVPGYNCVRHSGPAHDRLLGAVEPRDRDLTDQAVGIEVKPVADGVSVKLVGPRLDQARDACRAAARPRRNPAREVSRCNVQKKCAAKSSAFSQPANALEISVST
jgi:hypothetical protein